MTNQIHTLGCEDTAINICFWLDAKTFGCLAKTCQTFATLARNELIWETIARKSILNPPHVLTNSSWKDYVRKNGAIKLTLGSKSTKDKFFQFQVEINLKEGLIILYKTPDGPPYGDNTLLNEVFKRIEGPFTLKQTGKTFDGYYFRDLDVRVRTPSKGEFQWHDQNIQHKTISIFAYYTANQIQHNNTWITQYNACHAKTSTKSYTFKIINS